MAQQLWPLGTALMQMPSMGTSSTRAGSGSKAVEGGALGTEAWEEGLAGRSQQGENDVGGVWLALGPETGGEGLKMLLRS